MTDEPAQLERRLAGRFAGTAADAAPVTFAELLAADAALLRDIHARLVATDGAAPAAAAHYLAAWYAGGFAAPVGYALATAAVGVVLDAGRFRLSLAPEGWPHGVELAVTELVVGPEHPWVGLEHVTVVADDRARDRYVVARLIDAVGPMVEGCRRLARVGGRGLWNEVADSFALAVSGDRAVTATPAIVDVLRRALVDHPARPWSSVPDLWVDTALEPPACFGRKGGCCLAYTGSYDPAVFTVSDDMDPTWRRFLIEFPHEPGDPHYCNACPLRPIPEVAARLRFWYDHAD